MLFSPGSSGAKRPSEGSFTAAVASSAVPPSSSASSKKQKSSGPSGVAQAGSAPGGMPMIPQPSASAVAPSKSYGAGLSSGPSTSWESLAFDDVSASDLAPAVLAAEREQVRSN